jgi:uncharacterized protein (UPF0548 family)
MILSKKPLPPVVREFLQSESQLDFTYDGVGTTATVPPPGYTVDSTRIKLGVGRPTFLAAKHLLETWGHFDFGWVEAVPRDTPIQAGSVVAVLVRCVGLWWLNSARIVYVVDENDSLARFGFAYGTLPGHAEMGEERFTIEWNQVNDEVWYDILAFSRPRHILARMGYPLVRRLQKRFARDSCQAMLRGVLRVCSNVGISETR